MPGAQEAARAPTRRQVPQRLDHRHQTGLSLMPGIGFEIRVPYQDNKDCGDPDRAAKRVCTGGTPLFLDLQLAFGISSRIDLMADLRFGLDTPAEVKVGKQFAFAPGVRVWLDQDSNLKFYTTGQFVYDSTTQNQINVSDQDYGVRNANGLMYDVIRNVGFFFQFGETIGFKRWFRISLDAGLGVQVRFP